MLIAKILTALVGAAHLYFGYQEIANWEAFASRVLQLAPDDPTVVHTVSLAANQGAYNGFLGVGLLLAAATAFGRSSHRVALYLLACVFVAGVVGWMTLNQTVFLLVQTLPATVAALACWVFWRKAS